MDIEVETWHPKLKENNYKIINVEKNLGDFNCIAFVIDVHDTWCGSFTSSWPYKTISRQSTLENYIKYFNTFGYEICDNDKYEEEFDKIAIYISKLGNVTHAARQYENKWRSKLGGSVIIEHELDWLTGFDADNYGNIGSILKKNK